MPVGGYFFAVSAGDSTVRRLFSESGGCIIREKRRGEKKMIFIPLNKDDDNQCRSFEEMMDAYTLELDEHLGKNTPREVIGRWVKSIIEKQGAADRHLELCWEENEPVGFLFGKVDHPEHRG